MSTYIVSSMLPTPKELLYSEIGTKYLKQIDDQLQEVLTFVREGITAVYKESYATSSPSSGMGYLWKAVASEKE